MLASGIATFILLPYDFYSFNFLNEFSFFSSFYDFLGQNFSPFGNISYITEVSSTIGFTKLVIVIFMIGIFFFLLKGFFGWFTHRPLAIYSKIKRWKNDLESKFPPKERWPEFSKKFKPWFSRKRCEFKKLFLISGKEKKQSGEEEKNRIYDIKFAKWARDNQYKPYLDYIWIFEEVTLGVFYACEFLLLLLITVSMRVFFHSWQIFRTSWFEMLIFSLILLFLSYWLYRVTKRKHKNDKKPFKQMFENEKE